MPSSRGQTDVAGETHNKCRIKGALSRYSMICYRFFYGWKMAPITRGATVCTALPNVPSESAATIGSFRAFAITPGTRTAIVAMGAPTPSIAALSLSARKTSFQMVIRSCLFDEQKLSSVVLGEVSAMHACRTGSSFLLVEFSVTNSGFLNLCRSTA